MKKFFEVKQFFMEKIYIYLFLCRGGKFELE